MRYESATSSKPTMDLLTDPPAGDEEEVIQEVDSLLRSLEASHRLRTLVSCRLRGYSRKEIALQMGLRIHEVFQLLIHAQEFLIYHGVVSDDVPDSGSGVSHIRGATSVQPERLKTPTLARLQRSGKQVRPCPCCDARFRSLTPMEAFGWRQVYKSEVRREASRPR